MKLTQLLLWLVISTSLLSLGHFYVRRRLVRDPGLPRAWQRGLTTLLVVLLILQPLTFALARNVPRDAFTPVAYVAFVWMGLLSTLVFLLSVLDLARLGRRVALWIVLRVSGKKSASQPERLENPERRLLLSRVVASGVTLTSAAVVGVGTAEALADFQLVPVDIELSKLPRAFDGFRVAQISDIHIGPTIGHDFIERMVEHVNAVGADLIAITGDLVDGTVDQLRVHAAPLAQLSAPHGVYFVTGNHEYYSGADDWVLELERLGIPTLRNRRVSVSRGEASFDLAGVTDHRAGQFDDGPDLARALLGRDPTRELVLLAHQPIAVFEAVEHDVGLQLSGHTHGGQFWPWSWVIYLIQPIVRGLGRFGRTQVYVNTGTGYWGPPVRHTGGPEITVLTLKSSAAAPTG